ncbi:MAG: hypothetical protein ABIF40_01790 [archaeon]
MKLYHSVLGALVGAVALTSVGCKPSLWKTTLSPMAANVEVTQYGDAEIGTVETRYFPLKDRTEIIVENSEGKEVDALQGLAKLIWENGELDEVGNEYNDKKYVMKWAELSLGKDEFTDPAGETHNIKYMVQISTGFPADEGTKGEPLMVQDYIVGYDMIVNITDGNGNPVEIVAPMKQLYAEFHDFNVDGLSLKDGDKIVLPNEMGMFVEFDVGDTLPMNIATEDVFSDYATVTVNAFKAAEEQFSDKEESELEVQPLGADISLELKQE